MLVLFVTKKFIDCTIRKSIHDLLLFKKSSQESECKAISEKMFVALHELIEQLKSRIRQNLRRQQFSHA